MSLISRLGTLGEIFAYFWQRKLWWMIPLLIALFLLAIAIIVAQVSAVAPWMYPA